eukprot:COSAG01_NODE_130_length_24912_cov_83.574175_3_plen_110_part_00
MHATLAQPTASADALKDLRAQRQENRIDFLKTSGWIFGPEQQNSQDFLHAYNARSLNQDPVLLTLESHPGWCTAAATAVGGRPDTLGPGAGPWTVAQLTDKEYPVTAEK